MTDSKCKKRILDPCCGKASKTHWISFVKDGVE